MIYQSRGLDEFQQAMGRAGKELRRELRSELRGVSRDVAIAARGFATRRTVRRTGDLIAGIRPYEVRGPRLGFGVVSDAVHRGYGYPRRLEFEGGFRGPGKRASLIPGVELKRAATEKRLETVLNHTVERLAR